MKPRMGLIACLVLVLPAFALAKGRQPDDEDRPDNFPDYNRLEMRPRPKVPATPPPAVGETPPAPPPARPTLNTPVNPPSYDEDKPQPPPKAVPLPESAGEPPMPDDIKDTLVPDSTTQSNQR